MDFSRLGVELRLKLLTHPRAGSQWEGELQQLHQARNGVVHDDLSKIETLKKEGRELSLETVVRWRNLVDELVVAMDDVVSSRMSELFGKFRWDEGDYVGL